MNQQPKEISFKKKNGEEGRARLDDDDVYRCVDCRTRIDLCVCHCQGVDKLSDLFA
ncbi:MAG: hypothetical protein WCT33_03260 [Patescibacteria group bacterium]